MDLVIRSARVVGADRPVDIGVRGERIARVGPGLPERGAVEIDAEGRLVTPALVEPHLHLDAVLTEGEPRSNRSGSLFEGIEIWAERVKSLTVDDVTRRADTALRWLLAHGVTHLRAHVDVCDPSLTAVRALIPVRDAWRGIIDIQLVAFPQQGIYSFPDGETLMVEALELGVDVVGGIPHYEWTREYGERDVKTALALAARYGRPADLHCDETDDDQSRFLEVLAAETIRLGLQGRVTASHTTAMHSYNNAYAYKLIRLVRTAGLHFVTNPLDNSVLQGRFDSYPDPARLHAGEGAAPRRRERRLRPRLDHGPLVPLRRRRPGPVVLRDGPLRPHVRATTSSPQMLDFVTTRAAACLGLADYGLAEGRHADLVVFDAPTPVDAVRTLAVRTAVISRGRVVARTTAPRTMVNVNGRESPVAFLR